MILPRKHNPLFSTLGAILSRIAPKHCELVLFSGSKHRNATIPIRLALHRPFPTPTSRVLSSHLPLHSSRHHVRETWAPSTRPSPCLVISAATNPAVAPPPPRVHAILHHVHPSSLSPTTRHQHQHMYAFSKNKPTFFSRTYLCEIFPVGMSSTVRTPQASNLPRINTPTAANAKPCALSGLSPSSQPPTRHPDERSDANMQYPAHADLSTRLDSRWDILPAQVYYTTTSQRRAHIPRYDGVNSILDGTATPLEFLTSACSSICC